MYRRTWLRLGVGGFCLAGLGVGLRATGLQLTVFDATDAELLSTSVEDGSEVIVEYTHSVEKTLIRDQYVVSGNRLVMSRMEFSSFGAGLPAQADVRVENGRYVYEPPPQEYETLRLTTGAIADHDLIVDGHRYDIASMAAGETIELRITERRHLL